MTLVRESPSDRERPQERGAAAVEFALILPILITLVLGIMEFGFAFNAQIALTQAAREGVRIEALHYHEADSADQTEARTRDAFLSSFATDSDLDVVVDECPDDGDGMATVEAEMTDWTTPITRFGPFSLSAEAVMRCGG